MNVEQALTAADEGEESGLIGQYPMAAQVLAAEVRDLRDQLKRMSGFSDLWYFAMDSAPLEFERIVTTHSPSVWMAEIAKLRRASCDA